MGKIYGLFIAIALTVYAFIDCAQATDVRNLPKPIWLIIILVVPILGPLLWLTLGRYNGGGWWWRGPEQPAPDDDPAWLRRLSGRR